ncbi:MAG: 30S ribosomal protein S6 [Christensenellaceae bacterium]
MKYEMLYILNSAMSDEAKDAEIAKYEETVKAMGGAVVSTEKWGVRKLAYPIAYKADGYYVVMTFESEGSVVAELTRLAGISGDVMRCVITKTK